MILVFILSTCLFLHVNATEKFQDIDEILQRLLTVESKLEDSNEEIRELRVIVKSQNEKISHLETMLETKVGNGDAHDQLTPSRHVMSNVHKRLISQRTLVPQPYSQAHVSRRKNGRRTGKNRIVSRQGPNERVAFTVYLDHNVDFGKDQTVKFNQVITNEGNSYNVYTGVFTCPVAGLYLFSFAIGERHEGSGAVEGAWVGLQVNSANTVDAAVDSYHLHQDLQAGNTAVLRLNQGDAVWIQVLAGQTHVDGASDFRLSSFTGVYLSE